MGLFDNLTKKVQDAAFVAADKAQEVAAVAGEKAQEVADRAKTEYAIAKEKHALYKNFRAIGEWYLSTLGEEVPEAIADIVGAVRESQAKLEVLEAARSAKGDAEDEADDIRYCSACGEIVTGRFCSKCGTEAL